MSSDNLDVLIVGEVAGGALHPSVFQLISAARKAKADGGQIALCIPDGALSDAKALMNVNVDTVYLMRQESLVDPSDAGIYDLLTAAVSETLARLSPHVVLISKSDAGAIVGARAAARHGAMFAADCIDLALNPQSGRIAVTRPVHGGSALAVYEFTGDGMQVISIRPGAFDTDQTTADSSPKIEALDLSDINLPERRAIHLETVLEAGDGVPLESADIVVAGGRGLGGTAGFDELRELCSLLDAALGASRAACDAGWIDHSHQVGLTGKSINPNTYITIGISGASQHMAGCSAARNIVAINRDPDANIFSHSRFGVVGDWQKVLPAFTATVAELE